MAASSAHSPAPTATAHPNTDKGAHEGDIIAHGTIDDDGYGTTPVERAQFIIDTIRTHLARQICTLHHDDLSSIEGLLGATVNWCPACGARMSTG